MNKVLHVAVTCQARKASPGRTYYLRRIAEGNGKLEGTGAEAAVTGSTAANIDVSRKLTAIVSFLPVFMFAILFGLSMDYEVFILTRIREDYFRRRDARGAVLEGLSSSAQVITAAALIMISVFAAFVLGDEVTIKMFGVGLAVAVLVDATVVRMVLVPAAMALLDRHAWWLPGWLDRILPNLDVEGEALLSSVEGHPEEASPAHQDPMAAV